MRSVMHSVASIFASGLNLEVLQADTVTVAAQVGYNLTIAWQVPSPYPNELSLKPNHFSLHSGKPTATLSGRPQNSIGIFDPILQICVSNHLEAL